MGSLSAIPGYDALEAQRTALKAQIDTLLDQRDAAAEAFGGIASPQAQQYQQQAKALEPQYLSVIDQQQQLILNGGDNNLASPTVTTEQSQSTPAANARDDGPTQAPTQGGVGAGTGQQGGDNNTGPSSNSVQQAINTAFAGQIITSQPNVLDQYASYTYAISWWLLTPDQFNNLSSAGPAPGTANWSLLMQSGGAPIAGRNQAFPYDYYLDDLEIESVLAGKGNGMSTNAMSIQFKVIEPNGLTLLQNLFSAVSATYGKPTATTAQQVNAGQTTAGTVNANQSTNQTVNYITAQYCLTIEFYGYDSQGNLVAPATGSTGTGPQAVIKKYYPFLIEDITFRTVANQVEYNIIGYPIPYDTATSQARGTIPFAFQLSGQTVAQILQGGPIAAANSATNKAAAGERKTTPAPNQVASPPLPLRGQAAAAEQLNKIFGINSGYSQRTVAAQRNQGGN